MSDRLLDGALGLQTVRGEVRTKREELITDVE